MRRRGGRLGFWLRTLGVEPAARLVGCLLAVAALTLVGRLGDRLVGRERRLRRRAEREGRLASRVVRTLGILKGAFAKVGQFASLRYDVLPARVRAELATLRDRVPPRPLSELAPVIEEALGAPLGRLFRHVEPEPLAAASIAQVHRAILPDGTTVAVKVQYPWLRASMARDLALLRLALSLSGLARGRPGLDRRRLFDEFATSLWEELDFEREARTAEEIGRNLAGDPEVVVPRVLASHSSRRVLTTSYHRAVPITDRSALGRLGLEPAAVLAPLARAYAKQIFVDGLFHADPHPGNLLVVDEEAPRPRVLFVDFGLSRRLDPQLRRELRAGILALLRGDADGFLDGMERMGMIAPGARPGVGAAVREMFRRIRQEGAPAGMTGGRVLALEQEAKRLLQETEGLQLPNDLLLYAKTLSYLFALGEELDPDLDLMRLSLPYLMRFLANEDGPASGQPPG